MSARCDAPLSEDELLDYWTEGLADADAERVETHVFSCAECAGRLEAMASLGAGLATLVRRGRIAGVVSRSLLNRIQRDGVHVRFYSVAPGERVACAAFPGDDLIVLALRTDFGAARSVDVALVDPGNVVVTRTTDVPVTGTEILWATPGDVVRRIPTARMRITVTSPEPETAVLAEYELDHTSMPAR
jgi:hypothetical protein